MKIIIIYLGTLHHEKYAIIDRIITLNLQLFFISSYLQRYTTYNLSNCILCI